MLSTVTYDGTTGDDVFTVFFETANGVTTQFVNINGQLFTTDSTNDVVINGFAGDDHFAIWSACCATTLYGGNGNDTFTFGFQAALGPLLQPVVIHAGADTDAVSIDDSAGSIGSYITGSTRFAWDGGDIQFGPEASELPESLSITGKSGGSGFNIQGSPAASMTVNGSGADDNFDISYFDGLSGLVVNAGGGTNTLVFRDQTGVAKTYTLDGSLLTVDSSAILLPGFDDVTIDSATGSSVVKLNSFAGTNLAVHAFGGASGNATVNLGSGDLSQILCRQISVYGAPTDSVIINDSLSTIGKAYDIYQANLGVGVNEPAHSIYCAAIGVFLEAGTGNDSFFVEKSTAQLVLMDGGGGNDSATVGSGNLDAFAQAPLYFVGGSGTDSLTLNDRDYPFGHAQTLSNGVFDDGSLAFGIADTDLIDIEEGPGGAMVNLSALAIPAIIDGGSGSESVNIGAGNIDTNLLANVTVNGNAGSDTVQVNDASATNGGSYTYNAGTFRKGNLGKTVSVTGIEGDTLQTGRADDSVTVTGVTYPLEVLSGTGNDTVTANTSSDVTFNTGAETVEGFGSFGDTISVNPGGSGTAVMTVFHSDSVASVSTAVGGKLVIGSGDVLTNTHDLSNTGVIDLSGGALIVNGAASQLTQYQTWLKAGYAGGAWNGTSITINKVVTPGAINSALAAQDHTHFAVGFAPASAIFNTFPASFAGQSVTSTAMLVRYTTVGDANLDGKTNALDFNALATNFGSTSANWYQGDFNYDGKVNTTDFTALATNFNANLAPSAPLAAIASSTGPAAVAAPSNFDLFGKNAIAESDSQDELLATSV